MKVYMIADRRHLRAGNARSPRYMNQVLGRRQIECSRDLTITMSDRISGRCNCGRHVYDIPRPTEMNLCRKCLAFSGAKYLLIMY